MPNVTPAETLRARRPRPWHSPQDMPWGLRVRVVAISAVFCLLGAVILVAPLPFSGQVALTEGDVAPADVAAPRQVTYVSAIQTQKLQEAAAAAVPDVYDPPQLRIARQQLTLANEILTFIGSVRADSYADPATKGGYLAAIKGLDLTDATVKRTLSLDSEGWDRVAAEVQTVLDETMREAITENGVADERREVPNRIRLDLPDEDAAIVSQIVQSLVVPDSFYNAAKTDAQRQQARDLVTPATTTIERNEIILRAGDVVTAADLEALDAVGLKQAGWNWQDEQAAAGIMLILTAILLYYLWNQEPRFWHSAEPLLLAAILLVAIFFARVLVPAHALLSYVFPYAALGILLAVLINLPVSLVATAVFALLIGWLTNGSVEMMAYAFFGGLVGAIKVRRGDHLSAFAWAAAFAVYAELLVVVVFRVVVGKIDLRGLAEVSTAVLANGFVTVTVALLGTYLLGMLFGIATPLQLMEISRPTHPLLRQLLLKAPGTYHHTLIVGNMAERAAEAIGADAQLARVGAYYHDVGKTMQPYFYSENHSEGNDPHSHLDPYTSAQIIIGHVHQGKDLARKYRIPRRVTDFILEHHGTLTVSYFYHQAVTQAGSVQGVDVAQFTYPGPKPQSRETAITMLADCAEATVRAKHPTSVEEITSIVNDCVQHRVTAGQLDECSLTLGDLRAIQHAFVDVLRGIHHPRITYPPEARPETTTEATALTEAEAALGTLPYQQGVAPRTP